MKGFWQHINKSRHWLLWGDFNTGQYAFLLNIQDCKVSIIFEYILWLNAEIESTKFVIQQKTYFDLTSQLNWSQVKKGKY